LLVVAELIQSTFTWIVIEFIDLSVSTDFHNTGFSAPSAFPEELLCSEELRCPN
jgi:hypothetical protein